VAALNKPSRAEATGLGGLASRVGPMVLAIGCLSAAKMGGGSGAAPLSRAAQKNDHKISIM